MNHSYHKILSLLRKEITNTNDEQLLSELPLDVDIQRGFSSSFHENLMDKLFIHKESLETKIIQLFPRVAMSAAAAILILFTLNFSQIKNLDSLIVDNEVEEWIVSSSNDWLDEL